jgi:chorismate mutase / prephenate dehydratase
MSSEPRPLSEIRAEIDRVDEQLVELLNHRASLAIEVGQVKGRDGKPFFAPEREREIYEKLGRENPGPLETRQLAAIFREIISAARAAEKPLACAFWGPFGTFSHLAGLRAFGGSSELIPCSTILEVFQTVEQGKADYGVVPVENSVAGIVTETVDCFPHTTVKICAELFVPIQHHLVSISPSLGSIKRLYTGSQPAGQCRRWLEKNLPGVEIVECMPTAKGAERALGDVEGAAIANTVGAETVGIPILVENIHDFANNRTRFVVVGFNEPVSTGRDKTTLLLHIYNRPGALYKALGAFNRHDINLMLIESRPVTRGNFEYLFLTDVSGHRNDENMIAALAELKELEVQANVLGSYPIAVDAT